MQVDIRRVEWQYETPFLITGRAFATEEALQVELRENTFVGRGESVGVYYHGETFDSMLAQLRSIQKELSRGISRAALQSLLPAGGARNAIDCALWDLEAKRAGRRAWDLAGIRVAPIASDYTLSLDTPEAMARLATRCPQYLKLKLKLGARVILSGYPLSAQLARMRNSSSMPTRPGPSGSCMHSPPDWPSSESD